MENIGGIILAGGKSSRMGQDKGLMIIDNKPMVKHVINEFQLAGIETINIISNNTEYQEFNLPVISDIIKEKGPLGGIYTGLQQSTKEWNLIAPCDNPKIKAKYLQVLIKERDKNPIQVIKSRNKTHFLIGIIHHSVKDLIKSQIENGDLRVESWIKNLGGRIIELEEFLDFEESDFINVNTKEEFNKINQYENV